MPIFIETHGSRYEVIACLDDNEYLVQDVDKQGRHILTNTGRIIHYNFHPVDRIRNWLWEDINIWRYAFRRNRLLHR